MKDDHKNAFSTRSIRGGVIDRGTDAHADPLILSSSFRFASAEEAAARFAGSQPGNVYSRFTNPTGDLLQQRLALLEGGQNARLFATGMAAIVATVMSTLRPGDRLVAAHEIFGTTNTFLTQYLPAWGIDVVRVRVDDIDGWRVACHSPVQMLFVETPSNPQNRLADLSALAQLAEDSGALLAVDNTTCTPALQCPLAFGAHLSVLSLTKYFDGHGRVLGGAVVGGADIVEEKIYPYLRVHGATMSPFNAWMVLQGLQTLEMRMDKHCRSAATLAQWLRERQWVEHVYYPGLDDHPQHELAERQQKHFGGLVSFRLRADKQQTFAFINALQLISITANLGDAKTTVTHPGTTTHHKLTPEQKIVCAIDDNMVRFAVGLEDIADIRADIARAAEIVFDA
ncbi:MAG: PLP-dependent transferase [Gammaproteobacteria bacterium]|nr:PLP-dependent transferase [Gammaproteobacteria bacterium]